MRKRILRALVGGDKPRKPKRSLPSYSEPTPETHRHLTREAEAELALKRTVFTPGTAAVLITLFLLTISFVPAFQVIAEMRAPRPGHWLPMFDIFKTLPSLGKIRKVQNFGGFEHLLPRSAEIKAAEKELETDSVVSQWLLPRVQSVLTRRLGAGNEQVYLGRDGWLFYRPDVDYVTGPPFLDPAQLRQRAHAAGFQPDPVKAIVQFRDQLAARGIDLLVLPVPTKASIEGDKLSGRVPRDAVLQNPSFGEFKARLEAAGIRMFDPTALLIGQKKDGPVYLATDTHWRPEIVSHIAQDLVAAITDKLPEAPTELPDIEKEVRGTGDLARMLKLPADGQYPPEEVTIHEVKDGNNLWRPSRDADVLVLGDSFANIFSLDALGWGESAGLVEHLSKSLGGRPLDCILRNSDGAFATREMLAHELARGRDRLAGKTLVIWEFAASRTGDARAFLYTEPGRRNRSHRHGRSRLLRPLTRDGSLSRSHYGGATHGYFHSSKTGQRLAPGDRLSPEHAR